MAFTPQQYALDRVQREFGETAFTENHIAYRRVGTRQTGSTLSAIGETWDEAIANLRAKVANG